MALYKIASNKDPLRADNFAEKMKRCMESIEGKQDKISSQCRRRNEKTTAIVSKMKKLLVAEEIPRLKQKDVVKKQGKEHQLPMTTILR